MPSGPDVKEYIYNATLSRMAPWCAGTFLAYLMNTFLKRNIKLRHWQAMLGWIICLVALTLIVFGYFNMFTSQITKSIVASQTRLFWGVAICWIIFACHYGYSDIINIFLSLSIWQPLAKLSFCMYLLHTQIMVLNYGSTRYPNHYNIIEFVSICLII